MKNNLLKAATLFCVVSVLAACDKDKFTGPAQDAGITQANDPIEQLRTFRKQLKSATPGMKNGETMTFSDALWGIENNFNLTYSDVESYYSKVNDHEFELNLPVNADQQVLVNDVADLYSQVIDQVREAYIADELEDKGFLSLNIKDAEEEDGMIRISFSGKVGERNNYTPPTAHIYGPFGEDDNWMFAAPMGKCDDPDIPSGADEQLQEKLYIKLIEPFTKAASGYRSIFIDRKRYEFDGSTYDGIYYTQDGHNLCINHYDMNECFAGEKRVITQTIPTQYHLVGYTPVAIEITGTVLEDPQAFTHFNEIEYGIRTEVRIDEFGETEPLVP